MTSAVSIHFENKSANHIEVIEALTHRWEKMRKVGTTTTRPINDT